MTTWLGGIDGRPSAFRVSDSTITIRVKLVIITSSAGAIASSVSMRMMTTLWPGFFWPLASVPPKSIEIDASFGTVVGVAIGRPGTVGGVMPGVCTVGAAGGLGAATARVIK